MVSTSPKPQCDNLNASQLHNINAATSALHRQGVTTQLISPPAGFTARAWPQPLRDPILSFQISMNERKRSREFIRGWRVEAWVAGQLKENRVTGGSWKTSNHVLDGKSVMTARFSGFESVVQCELTKIHWFEKEVIQTWVLDYLLVQNSSTTPSNNHSEIHREQIWQLWQQLP